MDQKLKRLAELIGEDLAKRWMATIAQARLRKRNASIELNGHAGSEHEPRQSSELNLKTKGAGAN